MFLIGNSFFGQTLDSTCFDDNIPLGDTHEMDFENAIFDEVKIDTGNYLQPNLEKQDWGTHTIFDWLCNDLEAGNVKLGGIPIEFLRIKKKKIDDLTWNTYKNFAFNANKTEYDWSDFFIESLEDYDYAIVPVGANNVEGDYGIQSISTDYDSIFILGEGEQQFKFFANMNLDAISNMSESTFITTLGSQYPYEISNGSIDYQKGHLKLLLLTDETMDNMEIDRKAEKRLRNDVYKFFKNKKPKVFKESEGKYLLISIQASTVKVTPNNDFGRTLQEIEFDFIEIGNVNDISQLYNNHLIEVTN